jgi:hypothetical protein
VEWIRDFTKEYNYLKTQIVTTPANAPPAYPQNTRGGLAVVRVFYD